MELSLEELQALMQAQEGGDRKAIAEKLKAARELYPDSFEVHTFLSAFHLQENNLNGAIQEAAIALALKPDNPVGYRRLAFLLRRTEHAASSEAILRVGWERQKALLKSKEGSPEQDAYFSETPDRPQ